MAIALRNSNSETPNQNNCVLSTWADIMLITANASLWHFNQVSGAGAPFNTSNDKEGGVYLQTERELIARAMEQALVTVGHELNYWPRPAWFTETQPIGRGAPVRLQDFRTRYQKLIALGTRATSLIDDNVIVTYSDQYGTGIQDLASVTVTTTVADDEIQLYFKTADGAPTACHQRYRIEPVTVVDNGNGTKTIRGFRGLFVKPSIWAVEYDLTDPNSKTPNAADTADNNDFVTAVDVYRVYTDDSTALQVIAHDGTVLESFAGEIDDYEWGIVRAGGNWCSSSCWSRSPFKVKINYYAGAELVNGIMDNDLASAVVALANCNMDMKLTHMHYWAISMWQAQTNPLAQGNTPLLSATEARNPFGLRAGQVQAWKTVSRRMNVKGGKLTQNWW